MLHVIDEVWQMSGKNLPQGLRLNSWIILDKRPMFQSKKTGKQDLL